MAIFLMLKKVRDDLLLDEELKKSEADKKKKEKIKPPFPLCPYCGHEHRSSACICGCQNKEWRQW
jgi:hypothetical protein